MIRRILLLLIVFPCLSQGQSVITPIVTGLNNPVAFDFTPDGRYFITLKSGIIQAFDTTGAFLQNMVDISDSTLDYGECGMLGLCLDPQFPDSPYLYVYYNHFDSAATSAQAYMRVIRLTVTGNTAGNPLLLLDIPQLGYNHVGGNLHFPHFISNKLYVSIGENTIDAHAQLTTNPYGKILRINPDGSIPADNPFYDDGNPATGNDDRIWALGLRNSFDFAFNPLNDSLYATENGPFWDDEVNMIHAGGNYGWPTYTGFSNTAGYENPLFTWSATVAPTGILFYDGTAFPAFTNHLLVSTFNNSSIFDLTTGNSPYFDTVTSSAVAFTFGGWPNYLTALHQGTNGCIYSLYGGPSGILYRICPGTSAVPEAADLPLIISPVPSDRFIRIDGPSRTASKLTFTLYDYLGKILLSEERITTGENFNEILDLPELSIGMYLLKVTWTGKDGTTIRHKKILVQR